MLDMCANDLPTKKGSKGGFRKGGGEMRGERGSIIERTQESEELLLLRKDLFVLHR
jgi:hypothetical protein